MIEINEITRASYWFESILNRYSQIKCCKALFPPPSPPALPPPPSPPQFDRSLLLILELIDIRKSDAPVQTNHPLDDLFAMLVRVQHLHTLIREYSMYSLPITIEYGFDHTINKVLKERVTKVDHVSNDILKIYMRDDTDTNDARFSECTKLVICTRSFGDNPTLTIDVKTVGKKDSFGPFQKKSYIGSAFESIKVFHRNNTIASIAYSKCSEMNSDCRYFYIEDLETIYNGFWATDTHVKLLNIYKNQLVQEMEVCSESRSFFRNTIYERCYRVEHASSRGRLATSIGKRIRRTESITTVIGSAVVLNPIVVRALNSGRMQTVRTGSRFSLGYYALSPRATYCDMIQSSMGDANRNMNFKISTSFELLYSETRGDFPCDGPNIIEAFNMRTHAVYIEPVVPFDVYTPPGVPYRFVNNRSMNLVRGYNTIANQIGKDVDVTCSQLFEYYISITLAEDNDYFKVYTSDYTSFQCIRSAGAWIDIRASEKMYRIGRENYMECSVKNGGVLTFINTFASTEELPAMCQPTTTAPPSSTAPPFLGYYSLDPLSTFLDLEESCVEMCEQISDCFVVWLGLDDKCKYMTNAQDVLLRPIPRKGDVWHCR